MKAVVDEGVPRRLVIALRAIGCEIDRFPNEWKGKSNGQLSAEILAAGYDCLVTCDKNFAFQQNFSRHPIALVVLPKPDFPDLKPIVTMIHQTIEAATVGSISFIGPDGTVSPLPTSAKR